MTRPPFIHTTVVSFGTADVRDGSFIGPYCVLGFPEWTAAGWEANGSGQSYPESSRGVKIGADCQLTSHVVIGEGTVLGDNVWCDHHCQVGSDSNIGGKVEIMYGAKIYNRVVVGERAWVGGFVCNDAVIEPDAIVFGTLLHRFTNAVIGTREAAPIIRQGAFIGMQAIVVGDIEVGEGSYIAAGAVLTKCALPGRLYVGNPARDAGPAPKAFEDIDT